MNSRIDNKLLSWDGNKNKEIKELDIHDNEEFFPSGEQVGDNTIIAEQADADVPMPGQLGAKEPMPGQADSDVPMPEPEGYIDDEDPMPQQSW